MCGLAGYARAQNAPQHDAAKIIFEELMLAIRHRGHHATGIAVRRDGQTSIWKKAAPVDVVVGSIPWKSTMYDVDAKATIVQGHVRHATHANAHDDDAAHPFTEGKITGCHNGIIHNWREIGKEMKRPDWINDSQAPFGLLDAFKNPADALDHLDGYWALSWTKGESLFFSRTNDAPTAVAYVPSIRTLFWNSERAVLKRVLDSAKIGDYELWETKPNTVYRYSPSQFSKDSANGAKSDAPFRGRKVSKSGSFNSARPTSSTSQLSIEDSWRTRKWDATTAREVEDFKHPARPAPRTIPSSTTYTLRELNERIDELEAVNETLTAEIAFIYSVLNDSGILDREVVAKADASQRELLVSCNHCAKGEESGELLAVPTGGFVHNDCIFADA